MPEWVVIFPKTVLTEYSKMFWNSNRTFAVLCLVLTM